MESPDLRHPPPPHPRHSPSDGVDDVSDDVADDVTISSQMDLLRRRDNINRDGNHDNQHRYHHDNSHFNDVDETGGRYEGERRFSDSERRNPGTERRFSVVRNPRTLIAGTAMTPSSGYETDRTEVGGRVGVGGEQRQNNNGDTLLTLDSDFAVVVGGNSSSNLPAQSQRQQQQRVPLQQQLSIQTISGTLSERPRNPIFTEETEGSPLNSQLQHQELLQQQQGLLLQQHQPQTQQYPHQRFSERHSMEDNLSNWRNVRDEFQSQYSPTHTATTVTNAAAGATAATTTTTPR